MDTCLCGQPLDEANDQCAWHEARKQVKESQVSMPALDESVYRRYREMSRRRRKSRR